MYRAPASLILAAALLSGCSAAFTAGDTPANTLQSAALTPAAYSGASADRVAATDGAVATPGNAQREGTQLEAEDLDSIIGVADAHDTRTAVVAPTDDVKHTRMRLTAKDLDSLL